MNTTLQQAGNEIFEFLDGREYTLDGVHGHFRYRVLGRLTTKHELAHIPSDQGRESEAYLEVKRKLGDDWTTDLSNSLRHCEIAIELGYQG